MKRCKCAAGADTKPRDSLAGRGEEPVAGRAFSARLPHQHDFRRLERNHAACSLRVKRSIRISKSAARFLTRNCRCRNGSKPFSPPENFMPAGIRNSGYRRQRRRPRKLARRFAAACPLRRAHQQETGARIISRHGAVWSETRSRAIVAFAFCRNRDGTFRDQRDLFVRTIQNRLW